MKKNEDLFSVQIMDTRERIQGYEKDKMKAVENGTRSAMPAFGSRPPERRRSRRSRSLSANAARIRSGGSSNRRLMRATTLRLVRIVLLLVRRHRGADRPAGASAAARHVAGDSRRPAAGRLALADLRRQLHQPAAQPAHADYARERQPARPAVDVPDGHARQFRNDLALARQRAVRDGTAERRVGARRADGAPDLALPPRAAGQSLTACCGLVNRGFGMLGDKLFMVTLDAHLLALDMKTGAIVWDATLQEYKSGYASTIAPIVVKDKVIVGVAGGEFGIRGFIDAYDAQTGKRAWRFYTIPGPGEPGHETWAGDSWKIGGAGVWVTGAYDPEQNLLFYGTGNPGPDYHSESRLGDNLYSDSLVALDADTGKLRWHYQFTPHDVHDWDATEVPVLADITIAGQPRKVVMFANRNGFYYTLDRTTGKVIVAKPFVHDDVGEGDRPRRPAGACCRATRPTKRARSPVPTSPAAPTSGRRRSIRARGHSSSTPAKRA